MNTNVEPTIPLAALNLTGVSAKGKLLLALNTAEDGARNHRAQKVLGVSEAGQKNIRGRLVSKGLLRFTVEGWKLQVPVMIPPAGDAGRRRVMSLDEIRSNLNELLMRDPSPTGCVTYIQHFEEALCRILSDVPDRARKDSALASKGGYTDEWLSQLSTDENYSRWLIAHVRRDGCTCFAGAMVATARRYRAEAAYRQEAAAPVGGAGGHK
jgi:hypothetical protein